MDWLVDYFYVIDETTGHCDMIKTGLCVFGFIILLVVFIDAFYILKSAITSSK